MLLHLVIVEEALGGVLLIQAKVFNSSTVEVPARLSDVDDVLFTNIALILVANVVFVAHCASTRTDRALGFVALAVTYCVRSH